MQFVLLGAIILLVLISLFNAVRLISYGARGVGLGIGGFLWLALVPSVLLPLAAFLGWLAFVKGVFA